MQPTDTMPSGELLRHLTDLDACYPARAMIDHMTAGYIAREIELGRVWAVMSPRWQVWYLVRHGWEDPREATLLLLGELSVMTSRVEYRFVANYLATWKKGVESPTLQQLSELACANASMATRNFLRLLCEEWSNKTDRLRLAGLMDDLVRCEDGLPFSLRLSTLFPFDKICKPG